MRHNYLEEIIYSRFKKYQLIEAGCLYSELNNTVNEMAYYKALERLVKKEKIIKLAKGIYCIPAPSSAGSCPPQEKILNQLLSGKKGIVVGYSLYNSLNLTARTSDKIEVYSSYFKGRTKNIGNIKITNYNLKYNDDCAQVIKILEVLAHYKEIEDINHSALIELLEKFAHHYKENVVKGVLEKIHYPKNAIAFLKSALTFYGVKNNLSDYLSPFSDYNYPSMEQLYALA